MLGFSEVGGDAWLFLQMLGFSEAISRIQIFAKSEVV